MKQENILDKVRKILELAKNNPSKEEAESAALKAQKLLAEYHLSMADIEDSIEDEIKTDTSSVGGTKKWRWYLAEVVANNFRCRFYSYNKLVAFYGHESDVEVAKETFEYLFKVADKNAKRERDAIHKIYGTSAGIYNSYCMGFVKGLKDSLGKQCTALMLVVPSDVHKAYEDYSKGFGKKKNTVSARGNAERLHQARQSGYSAGKDALSHKMIAEGV